MFSAARNDHQRRAVLYGCEDGKIAKDRGLPHARRGQALQERERVLAAASKAAFLIGTAMIASACDSGGLSTTEVRAAAEERVRQSLGLAAGAPLFTDVFVGESDGDDVILCGTVDGTRRDGSRVGPRHFIAATEPARWVRFERADEVGLPPTPDFSIEWATLCAGERGDNGPEPLSVTEIGETE